MNMACTFISINAGRSLAGWQRAQLPARLLGLLDTGKLQWGNVPILPFGMSRHPAELFPYRIGFNALEKAHLWRRVGLGWF